MREKYIPKVVRGNNLSVVWAKAFLAAMEPRRELTPLVVMATDLNDHARWEDPVIRELIDSALTGMGKQSCNTVANTIFPESLWNPDTKRAELYDRYMRILPQIRRCPKNKRGIYFERLIAYCSSHDGKSHEPSLNQLEHIIQTYTSRDGVRRSVLQVSLFDPTRDHSTSPYLRFPCLQHVTFTPFPDDGTVAVNGFYAVQYLFERAYGNYLGLCRLGRFVGHELGFKLAQMNCTIGIATPDVGTHSVSELIRDLRMRLHELGEDAEDRCVC
jgi:hypothetical protein